MAKRDEEPAPAAERMIREGQEEGYPTVRFDPEKGQNYHLDALGRRVYHEIPAPAE